jgi:hypothetical protein
MTAAERPYALDLHVGREKVGRNAVV